MLQAGQLEPFAAHLLHVESVGKVRFTHATIIRNILTQCQFAVNLKRDKLVDVRIEANRLWQTHVFAYIREIVVTVLVHEAVGSIDVLVDCLVGPPLHHVASPVETPTAVIETVRQLVPQYCANRAVIQGSNGKAFGQCS